ncbi:MAG: hypothetical protein Kow001_11230 [Acidobacteriota bacterium]
MASDAFVRHTQLILDRAGIDGRDDDIFVPNISDTDLDALAKHLTEGPKGRRGPTWHLFLRRDLPANPNLRVSAMQTLADWGGHQLVRFYTDTHELAEQHEKATGLPLTVLPIPIAPFPVKPTRKRRKGPLQVTYLGDARAEKGFALLPGILRACLPAVRARQVAFTIQTLGCLAEPVCERAAAELKALYDGPGLTLLPDRLTTGAYERLLAESDVILALYDPSSYLRRSSHVVVEGLCRGKIVAMLRGSSPANLVPSDCPWLCSDSQDAVDLIQWLASSKDPLGSWPPAPALQAELAKYHTGLRLAEALLDRSAMNEALIRCCFPR